MRSPRTSLCVAGHRSTGTPVIRWTPSGARLAVARCGRALGRAAMQQVEGSSCVHRGEIRGPLEGWRLAGRQAAGAFGWRPSRHFGDSRTLGAGGGEEDWQAGWPGDHLLQCRRGAEHLGLQLGRQALPLEHKACPTLSGPYSNSTSRTWPLPIRVRTAPAEAPPRRLSGGGKLARWATGFGTSPTCGRSQPVGGLRVGGGGGRGLPTPGAGRVSRPWAASFTRSPSSRRGTLGERAAVRPTKAAERDHSTAHCVGAGRAGRPDGGRSPV